MRTRVPLRAYADAFVTVLADTPKEQHAVLVKAWVRRLARDGVLSRAEHIVDDLERLLLLREGFLRADVRLAAADDRERVSELERVLGALVGQPVRSAVTADPRLLAGFRARVEDLLVDASLQGALARLRASMVRS